MLKSLKKCSLSALSEIVLKSTWGHYLSNQKEAGLTCAFAIEISVSSLYFDPDVFRKFYFEFVEWKSPVPTEIPFGREFIIKHTEKARLTQGRNCSIRPNISQKAIG